MTAIELRKATANDLEMTGKIYEKVIDYLQMPEHIVYANWRHGIYPTMGTALDALEKDELFIVCVDGEVAGSFVLNHNAPSEYANIQWGIDLEKGEYLVLHTLAVDPDKMNSGVGKMIMAYIEGYGKSNGYKGVRLDTSEGNLPGNRLYSGAGYTMVDSVTLEPQLRNNRIYNCYEKILAK